MSRSGYVDEPDSNWQLIKWRGMVASATRGKRGQQFFRDLIAALDAMPEKCLIADDLQDEHGDVCAIGSLGLKRGIDMSKLDPEEPEQIGEAFDIAPCLAQEVVYMNDEWAFWDKETPQQRWVRMRTWAEKQLHA